MNAPAHLDAAHAAHRRTHRQDGWTPEVQRGFLELVAEGHTVESACRSVGLSPQSAYALRRRAAGAAFALGWDGARLLARHRIADALTARAIDGQVECVTKSDGTSISRHRYDNRLAMYVLTRLDRQADRAEEEAPADTRAARLVAQDFDRYLDLVEQDAPPAHAGLFLTLRTPGAANVPDAAAALARQDLYLRTGAGLPAEVDISDLDPAGRHGWTAEQWCRAEAAGLVVFPAPEPSHEPKLPQLPPEPEEPRGPVWFDEVTDELRTRFPPPPDFWGEEEGAYGDPDYERALSVEEEVVIRAHLDACEDASPPDTTERDRWFAEVASDAGVAAPPWAARDDARAGEEPQDGEEVGAGTAVCDLVASTCGS